jgi:hypothetical protein
MPASAIVAVPNIPIPVFTVDITKAALIDRNEFTQRAATLYNIQTMENNFEGRTSICT